MASSTEEYFKKVQSLMNFGLYEINLADGAIKFIYDRATTILDLSKDQIQTVNSFEQLMPSSDYLLYKKMIKKCFYEKTNTPLYFEHLIETPNKKLKYIAHHIIRVSDNKILCAIQNISSKYINERNILKMAYYDPLTGLLNKSGLEKSFNMNLSLAKNIHSIAVIFIDLDNFKIINDSLGHDAGDILLKNICNIIKKCANEFTYFQSVTECLLTEVITARFGGDEFIVCVPFKSDFSTVTNFVNFLQKNINMPIYLKGREIKPSGSIGVSCFPKDGDNLLDLIKRADTAMYKSKCKKNTYTVFDKSMHNSALKRINIESELFNALKNNEIIIYYQPKICLYTGKIIGFESLARWHHPKKGLLLPDSFIGISEESDLILELTDYICEQCYKDYEEYFAPRNLGISINMSTRQFYYSLPSLSIFNNPNINASNLKIEFEITESILIDNFSKSLEMINLLKSKGFKCSLDDYGSSYSSLNYLILLPVDSIKIDKNFLAKIDNKSTTVILKSTISMINELGLCSIAEGIETKSQLEFLLQNNCKIGQGFLISKAISLEDIKQNKFTGDVKTIRDYILEYRTTKKQTSGKL